MCSTTLSQSETHVWKSLKDWFKKYGAPERIRCDNGGPFITEGKIQFFNFGVRLMMIIINLIEAK